MTVDELSKEYRRCCRALHAAERRAIAKAKAAEAAKAALCAAKDAEMTAFGRWYHARTGMPTAATLMFPQPESKQEE